MPKKIRIKFCPNCGNQEVNKFKGAVITGMETCLECDFTSPIFPEKEVDERDLEKLDREDKEEGE